MTDREDTVRHRAELIRRTIADESALTGLPVTVSIGVCIARAQAFETAFKLADDCLYESSAMAKIRSRSAICSDRVFAAYGRTSRKIGFCREIRVSVDWISSIF